MKKIVLFIFGLAALMFASCGQKEKHEKTSLQKDLPKREKSEKFSNKDFSEENTSSKIEKHTQYNCYN